MSSLDSLSPALVDFLLSDAAQDAAHELARSGVDGDNPLPALSALRRRFAPDEAGALLALVQLRRRGQAKLPRADRLYFTPEALEQATAWPVALHRAAWIDRHAPPGPVLDLGCGIGGDTLALAQHRPVIAYERSPVRLRFAQANAAAFGLAACVEFRSGDWTVDLAAGSLPPAAAVYVDPSRRVEGRRVFSLHQMQPPLETLLRLQARVPALSVKVMPGVEDAELPAGCGVEFVSHEGACKEAVLWFGGLAQHARWAGVHDGEQWHTLVASGDAPPLGPLAPGMVLYEPDPAVIRAGAFAELCARLHAHLFDAQIAYLVADSITPTPFAAAFRVLEVEPFHLKKLNARLAALEIGSVELKKRGAPFAPEDLRRRLKLRPGGRPGVVIFTRRGDRPLMLIAERARRMPGAADGRQ